MIQIIKSFNDIKQITKTMKSVVSLTEHFNSKLLYAKKDENILVYNERTEQLFSMKEKDLVVLSKSTDMFTFNYENRYEIAGVTYIKEDSLAMLYKHGVGPADVEESGTLRKAIRVNTDNSIVQESVRLMSSYHETFILVSETDYITLLHTEIIDLIVNLVAQEDIPLEQGLITLEYRHRLPLEGQSLNCELEVINFGNVMIVPSSHHIHIIRKDFLDASLEFKNLGKVNSAKKLISSNAISSYMDGLYVANIDSEYTEEYGYTPACIFGYKENLGVKIYFPKEFMAISKYLSDSNIKFFLDWEEVKKDYIGLNEIPVRKHDGSNNYILSFFDFVSQDAVGSISEDPLL